MKHLPLKKAYEFGAKNGIEKEVQEIRRSDARWKSYTSSVRRGLIIELFRKRGLFDKFKDDHWRFSNTEAATKHYLKIKEKLTRPTAPN